MSPFQASLPPAIQRWDWTARAIFALTTINEKKTPDCLRRGRATSPNNPTVANHCLNFKLRWSD